MLFSILLIVSYTGCWQSLLVMYWILCWDAASIFNHLPGMFLSTDFAFRITDWTCCHGPHLHAILRIISRGVSGLATDSPCGVWGRGWTTCLLHDSPLFGSHFKMRVGMKVWSDISYIYNFLPRFSVSCMKLVIFLLYNNLFIYQVLCTLIYRRRSLYSFLSIISINCNRLSCPDGFIQNAWCDLMKFHASSRVNGTDYTMVMSEAKQYISSPPCSVSSQSFD